MIVAAAAAAAAAIVQELLTLSHPAVEILVHTFLPILNPSNLLLAVAEIDDVEIVAVTAVANGDATVDAAVVNPPMSLICIQDIN